MSAQSKYVYCSVCDHEVVDGVACDGKPEECPLNSAGLGHMSVRRKSSQIRVRVADCAQPDEYDFIRGED